MTSGLQMKLLGTPDISFEEAPQIFATRKALALFVYLVVEGGLHPREKLQVLFWPESNTVRAQFALRTTLVRIKRALQAVNDPLSIEGDRVGFNFSSRHTLDLSLIREAASAARSTLIAVAAVSLLKRAVKAARGPFLEAFSLPDTPAFNYWVLIQRQTWASRLNLIFDRSLSHQLESRRIEAAIETVNRWLVLDHLNEVAYQHLMRLHIHDGNRLAAMRTYETCRHLLAIELGVEPSPATEELRANIEASSSAFRIDNMTQKRSRRTRRERFLD